MKSKNPVTVVTAWLALMFAPAQSASAQSAPAASPAAGRAAATAASSSTATSDATVLSPFEVKGDPDGSYGALNSNSINRLSTELFKAPLSAHILTETFMNDIGARNIEDMILEYIPGAGYETENGGLVGNMQTGDRNTFSLKLRGLSVTSLLRDSFMGNGGIGHALGVTSSFDVERVEIINGPQSLLYGHGGAGGAMNTVSKQARFGRRPSGSFMLRVDNYGNGAAQFDYSWNRKNLAVRVAATTERIGGRRDDIYGDLNAGYVQIAYKLGATTLRLSAEHWDVNRLVSFPSLTYTALSTANDVRNTQRIDYLLATNQLERAANGGASGGGYIGNGKITWDNLNSYLGDTQYETTDGKFVTLTAETRLNQWLSSELSLGYLDQVRAIRATGGNTLLAPNNAGNTLGVWAMSQASGGSDRVDHAPNRSRIARLTFAAQNTFFGGRVKSQTVVGGDYNRSTSALIAYQYYQIDSSGNFVVNPAQLSSIDFGRTVMGTPATQRLLWSVQDGPQKSPYWKPYATQVTLNGITYGRGEGQFPDSSIANANNPLGLTRLGGRPWQNNKSFSKGIFAANTLSLFDGRLDLLTGVRISEAYQLFVNQGVAVPIRGDNRTVRTQKRTNPSYSAGANFAFTRTLRAYVNVSDSYNPGNPANDPYGVINDVSHGIGVEGGIKISNTDGTVSGTLGYYETRSTNDRFSVNTVVLNAINPAGLNGQFGFAGNSINASRKSHGLDLQLTTAPVKNWRMRFAASSVAGTVGSTANYDQVYNDQFYANSAGQVTYRNGAVVYVNPTFTAATPTVSSTAPGAIPLTIAMMSTPGNSYYANPVPTSGAINSGSNAAAVLRTVDPAAGPILTGITGLPMSQQQINPGFTVPGTIPVSRAGEATVGFPTYSFSFTNVYTFDRTALKGFRIGGTLSATWDYRAFYYFPTGVTLGAVRQVQHNPDRWQFNLISGYSWKLFRLPVSTQVNVSNLFNNYRILIYPNPNTGFAGPLIATPNAQPRSYVLTNTISF